MKRCDHCGAKAGATWNLAACALPAMIKGHLCWPCDIAFNALTLAFFGVPKRKDLIRKYRKERLT